MALFDRGSQGGHDRVSAAAVEAFKEVGPAMRRIVEMFIARARHVGVPPLADPCGRATHTPSALPQTTA